MGRMLRASDGPALANAELRNAPRIALTLRTAKLVAASGELLCVLRDVSQTGFKARLFHPLPEDEHFALDLGNGTTHDVDPVWQDGAHAGFRFVEGPLDLHALLGEHDDFHRRHLRLNVQVRAWIRLGGEARSTTVQNISQSGAMVLTETPLPVGTRLTLVEPNLGEIGAQVCWRRHEAHGLAFTSSFRLDEMALIVDRLQHDGAPPARGPENRGEARSGAPV